MPRDDRKPAVAGEQADDVFGQPVAEIVVLGIIGHVPKRHHGDRRSRDGLSLYRFGDDIVEAGQFGGNRDAAGRIVPADVGRERRRLRIRRRGARVDGLDVADETKAALVQGPDQGLVVSIVAKRTPGAIDPAGKRRFGDDPAIPDRLDQLILADDPLMIAHQMNDQIEYLGLNMNSFPKPAQLLLVEVDLELAKLVF